MNNYAPVALFAYARPDHTRKTVEALAGNDLADHTELFVFSDGPRSESDAAAVRAVREYLRTVQSFRQVNIVERSYNLGLADSIVDGVTSVVGRYGKVIVLEDDIVTSPYFLRYMNDALDRYEHTEQVMHVAGYMFPIQFPESVPPSFFLRQSSCWGWGTWQRAWSHFHRNANVIIARFNHADIRRFNLDGTYDYWSQLLANHEGKLKTWAVYWYACVFSHGGLCLHPRTSLIHNIGFDGSGQNCALNNNWRTRVVNHPLSQFPETLSEHSEALEAIERGIANKPKRPFVERMYRSMHEYLWK
jgi:hypothetical protein